MIVASIFGGLGNQMFQYAAGFALADRLKTHLILDLSAFKCRRVPRKYDLDRLFCVRSEVASDSSLKEFLGWRKNKLAMRVFRRPFFTFFRGKKIVVEPHFHYWKNFVDLLDDVYLLGYWQSEKYFSNVKSLLRKEFEYCLAMPLVNEKIATQMNAVNSVSVHVRRGDYVTSKSVHRMHGVCSLGYYIDSINYISERVTNPVFYFFSDDIEWARNNIGIRQRHLFIDYNYGENSYNDMRLMALCKHNIIANSSFSWWGAWLNINKEKIVIAPKRWFCDSRINTDDVCPESWIRL